MWTWSLNWGEITPDIVVGSCPMSPGDLDRIRSVTGISAVLSLQHDDCLAHWGIDYAKMRSAGEDRGLAMVRCPIRDFDIQDMRRRLPEAVRALARLQRDGHSTYVHCTAGQGRAPLVVLAYLTLVARLTPDDAIERILSGRPGAVPAWEAYHGCRADLAARHYDQIMRRAYELYRRGTYRNADADWHHAESDVLREVLVRS